MKEVKTINEKQDAQTTKSRAWRRTLTHFLERATLPIALVLFLEWLVRSGQVSPIFLSPPSEILSSLLVLAFGSGVLWADIGASLMRLFIGFGVALVVAVPSGILVGWFPVVRESTDGLLRALRPIPPVTLIPLSILWFGIGTGSAAFIIGFASFWPLLLNTQLGMREIPSVLLRVSSVLELSRRSLFRKLILPAVLPKTLAGIRVGIGYGFMALVAAEMIGARSGLGYRLLESQRTQRISDMFATLLVLALLGLILNQLVNRIERHLLRWR